MNNNASKMFKELIGLKVNEIYFQPTAGLLSDDNMFVFNFVGKEKIFSLHCFTFLRVIEKDQIILTSSDEFFDIEYHKIAEQSNDDFTERSLLKLRIDKLKDRLKNNAVKNVVCHKSGDVTIIFSSAITMSLYIDCHYCEYEYYRLLDLTKENKYLVTFFDSNIVKTICVL